VAVVEVIFFDPKSNQVADISGHHTEPFHLLRVITSEDILIPDSESL
jgi:hypothetical protein